MGSMFNFHTVETLWTLSCAISWGIVDFVMCVPLRCGGLSHLLPVWGIIDFVICHHGGMIGFVVCHPLRHLGLAFPASPSCHPEPLFSCHPLVKCTRFSYFNHNITGIGSVKKVWVGWGLFSHVFSIHTVSMGKSGGLFVADPCADSPFLSQKHLQSTVWM